MESQQELVGLALKALGVERLVLAIHDVSFPSAPHEDVGRGSPYTKGGRDFITFVRGLGFDGIQLGPQGQTSLGNSSPYDGSVFSKSELSIGLTDLTGARFAWVLPSSDVQERVASRPAGDQRAHYIHAFEAQTSALGLAYDTLTTRAASGDQDARAVTLEIAAFVSGAPWLAHDARFEAFASEHGTDDWRTWPERDRAPDAARIEEIETKHARVMRVYELGQYVLDAQHRDLRAFVAPLGVRLYGDLQVGLSLRDRWARGERLFLSGYRMGAPPSRTNPEGQPWGYPVFDPRREGAVAAFVRARVAKLFAELDGVRIDHPHGLVCPWVYDAAAADPLSAVVHGARLFETPSSTQHPSLAAFAIARPDQIDPSVPDHDDDHVRDLDEAQVDRYAHLFDVVMDEAKRAGRGPDDVLCEVLSTCPRPLACVMQRYALGRFRVTQKASLVDPSDGYRGENAEARDWIMIGNHDTQPLLAVIAHWRKKGTISSRADYLASRLVPDPSRRAAFAAAITGDAQHPRALVTAMFAELFVGPASNVLVFFADLFGEYAAYNTPGLVSDDNWSMRVPSAYREIYEERRTRGEAMDIPAALALAMRARGDAFVRAHEGVISALEAL